MTTNSKSEYILTVFNGIFLPVTFQSTVSWVMKSWWIERDRKIKYFMVFTEFHKRKISTVNKTKILSSSINVTNWEQVTVSRRKTKEFSQVANSLLYISNFEMVARQIIYWRNEVADHFYVLIFFHALKLTFWYILHLHCHFFYNLKYVNN